MVCYCEKDHNTCAGSDNNWQNFVKYAGSFLWMKSGATDALANWSWSLIFDLQNWRSILYYLKCLTVYWNQIIWCSGGFWCWANNVLKPNFKLNHTNLAKLKFTTFKLPSQHQCMDEIPNGGCKLSCDLIFDLDLDLWSNRSLSMILIFYEWSWS